MKRGLSVLSVVVFALVAQACGGDDGSTSYNDFLKATGTAYLADTKTAATSVPITDYNWIVTFSDGSTVPNHFSQPGLVTDTKGKFGFAPPQLFLTSGNQEQTCDQVCIEWDTGNEWVCTDYEQSCSDYCADWETDDNGDEYCADWETSCDTYCANGYEDFYQYCGVYGQDCGYIYPSRLVSDITSAYSEITYDTSSGPMTAQSEETTLPAMALGSSSAASGKNTTVTQNWTESDTYVTTLTSSPATTATVQSALVGGATEAQLQNRARLTSQRNAAKGNPVVKHLGTKRYGRNHKPSLYVPAGQLGSMPKLKSSLEAIRAKCGAYPKSLK
jgi:hypothetical protein